jgi:hypothetical protein
MLKYEMLFFKNCIGLRKPWVNKMKKSLICVQDYWKNGIPFTTVHVVFRQRLIRALEDPPQVGKYVFGEIGYIGKKKLILIYKSKWSYQP